MSLLRSPANAWPTQLLAALALSLHLVSLIAALTRTLPMAACLLMSLVAILAAFTPMHDASHRSVSKNRLRNEVIGRLCALLFLTPFSAFRYVHLEHHKHTNDPDLDPDHYAGRGPAYLLPLRWLSQDLHYYWLVALSWRQRTRAEMLDIALSLIAITGLIYLLIAAGHGGALVWAWILPLRLAIPMLALSFDYLPHRPHQTTSRVDRFGATRVIECPGLTPLLLYQNYHLIHHLYPGVPFYRYKQIYEAQKVELLAKGMQVTRWLGGAQENP